MKEAKQDQQKGPKKEKKKKNIMILDFIVPFVSGSIFILVLFFVLIPSINNSQEVLVEIERVQEEQKIVERNLELVRGMNFTAVQGDLSNARRILPRSLEVAQFAYYIDSLAQEKGLNFRELKASSVAVSRDDLPFLNLKGIRVPMGYSGDYEPILDFFNELQTVSPYVISFGHKVDLRKSGTEEDDDIRWNLEIDVTGYYVEELETSTHDINLSMPIGPYDSDPNVVEEFEERIKRLVD